MTFFNLGIIGHPVAHSLSPLMHNAALKALNIEGNYAAQDLSPENFDEQISLIKKQWSGWNTTVPFKGEIIRHLDTIDPDALQINSVNTVVRLKNGQFWGTTTDGYGLLKALEINLNFHSEGEHVLLIGAGGAARAAAGILAQNRIRKLSIVNRTIENAKAIEYFVKTINPLCEVQLLSTHETNQIRHIDLAVQCTSLGLSAGDPLPFDPQNLPEQCRVFDMIYDQTPFLQAAKQCGHHTSDGLDMLLYQGVKSFEFWTDSEAPIAIMKHALYQAKGRPCTTN